MAQLVLGVVWRNVLTVPTAMVVGTEIVLLPHVTINFGSVNLSTHCIPAGWVGISVLECAGVCWSEQRRRKEGEIKSKNDTTAQIAHKLRTNWGSEIFWRTKRCNFCPLLLTPFYPLLKLSLGNIK